MKKTIAVVLSIALCITVSLPVSAGGRDYPDYNDANLSNLLKDGTGASDELYYKIEANWLNHLGLIDGISSATFNPALYEYATKEQATKLISTAFGWSVDMEAISGYADVSPWAEPYVAAAISHGITDGIDNDLFGAKDPITAHQLFTMLLKGLGYTNSDIWSDTPEYTERAFGIDTYPYLTHDNPIKRDELVGIIFLVLLNGEVKGEAFTLLETIALNDEILASEAINGGLISRYYKTDSNGLGQRDELIDIGPLFTTISTSASPYYSALKHFEDLGYKPLTYVIGTEKSRYELPESSLTGTNTLKLLYRFGELSFTLTDGKISLQSIKIDETGHFSYKSLNTGDDISTAKDIVFNGESIDFDTGIRYYSDTELQAYINTQKGDGINIFTISPMDK